ncbi:MAG: L-seryl-tRNA(Sec) selenium transferase, partial [Desulfovibrionaceae bacterium]
AGEPTVQSVVAHGADVVSFSGDKVLGGPQAGLIVGRSEYISKIKKNPMNRALRIDKMTLAGLEATLRLYLEPERALAEVPTLRMITMGEDELKRRAARLARRLRETLGDAADISTRKDNSRVGGGSYPERDLPTVLVCVRPRRCSVSALKERLLSTEPPMIARLEEGELRLDPRTMANDEHKLAASALAQALKE